MANSRQRAPHRPGTGRAARSGAARQPRGGTERRLLYTALVVVIVAVGAVVAAGDDDGNGSPDSGALLRTEAPWEPQTEGLQGRVEAAAFPPVGDESYHVHALLSVFIDGKPVTIPPNIGVDPVRRFLSPLHTHTPDGVIHFEADDPAPFTLGQFFTVWGVDFGPDRLGAYTPQGEKRIHSYVNGEPVDDPVGYELREGDNVVVAFGADGSFPSEPPTDALRRQ